MNNDCRAQLPPIGAAAAAFVLALTCAGNAAAQAAPSGTGTPSGTGPSSRPSATTSGNGGGDPADPNPYYIGVSQALTHGSNVFRIPGGPSDNYSSTSLLGGFDQSIGRQRVFGRAVVTANRYQDQDTLNNVSYGVNTGIDWETIEHLSGGLTAALNRGLASQPASGGTPVATRNVAETQTLGARVRWGGVSLLTLDGGLDYSNIDYSAPQYVSSESSRTGASVNLYYRSGAPLRLGVGIRGNQTRTPKAFVDPATGQYQSTRLNAKHFDLLADYDLTGRLLANGRLSYTRQTNSGAGNGADFSGITGNVALSWNATGKTTIRFDAARDVGFNATTYNTFAFTPTATGIALTPVVGLYQNNQVTNSAGIGVSYAATAKISATANARYQRARLTNVNAPAAAAAPEVVDVTQVVALGVNYGITRNWSAACNVSREHRSVSGGTSFSYNADTIGCSTQFTWR